MIGSCDVCTAQNVPVSKGLAAGGVETVSCYLCSGDEFDPYGEMEIYVKQVDGGTDNACWVICAKGDPGALLALVQPADAILRK